MPSNEESGRIKDEFGQVFYTAREVGLLFRVDPETVGRWRRAGLLPSVRRPGRGFLYPRADIDALAGTPAPGGTAGTAECPACGTVKVPVREDGTLSPHMRRIASADGGHVSRLCRGE